MTKVALVNLFLSPSNTDFARFAAGLLPAAVHTSEFVAVHRTLVAFHTGVLFDFVKKAQARKTGKAMSEGTAAWFLPAAMDPLQTCAKVQVEPSKEALVQETIVSSASTSNHHVLTCYMLALVLRAPVSPVSYVPAVLCCAVCHFESSRMVWWSCLHQACAQNPGCNLCGTRRDSCWCRFQVGSQGPCTFTVSYSLSVGNMLTNSILSDIESELADVIVYAGSEKFLTGFINELTTKYVVFHSNYNGTLPSFHRLDEERRFKIILTLLPLPQLPTVITTTLVASLLWVFTSSVNQDEERKHVAHGHSRAILVQLQQRYPTIVQKCFEGAIESDAENKAALEQILLSLSLVRGPAAHSRTGLALTCMV